MKNFVFCILIFGFTTGCQNKILYKETQALMGSFVEVTSPDKRAARIVFAELKRIEGLLSKYKEDSEISRLNRLGELKVSPETLFVIKKAKEFSRITEGAFDITVGPLMDLWGFAEKKYNLPPKAEIEKALNFIGSEKIILDEDNFMIKLKFKNMKVDLGGIAVGYAVDCAVNKLKENGINNCLINAGGDIYCLGDKFTKPWKIAIQNPRAKGFIGYLELKDRAVSTSGDYEQYFTKSKKRYSHILNPKAGYPIDTGVISATVIAPDCLTADVLATSIFVLGKERAETLLAKEFPEAKVKIIEEKDVPDNR